MAKAVDFATILGYVFCMARKFWGMISANIHKFWGVISSVKMAHLRHLRIKVIPGTGAEFVMYQKISSAIPSCKQSRSPLADPAFFKKKGVSARRKHLGELLFQKQPTSQRKFC